MKPARTTFPTVKTHGLLLVFALLILTGCQQAPLFVPVTTVGEGGKTNAGYHLVQAGETLYSIAWRYGMDYRELASANQVGPSFTIYVNQKLNLVRQLERESGKPAKISAAGKATAVNANKTKERIANPRQASQATNIKWSWPVMGTVIREFSLREQLNKGIDIRSKLGQPVSSAADGVVVYAGGGLRGFGKLIIVKHTQNYLSAYGHNRVLLVKEGEKVKGGQHVAEIGSNGSNEEMLHFEIRRNGKPENPLNYLPKL